MSKEAIDATVDAMLKDLKVDLTKGIQSAIKNTIIFSHPLVELLYEACADGNFEVVKYLIENRDYYFNKKSLNEALYKSLRGNNINVVKYLEEKGAEINYSDVSYEEITNKDILKYLLENGAEIIRIHLEDYPDKYYDEVNDFARKLYLTKYANKK